MSWYFRHHFAKFFTKTFDVHETNLLITFHHLYFVRNLCAIQVLLVFFCATTFRCCFMLIWIPDICIFRWAMWRKISSCNKFFFKLLFYYFRNISLENKSHFYTAFQKIPPWTRRNITINIVWPYDAHNLSVRNE